MQYLCQALCGTVTLPPETGEDQEHAHQVAKQCNDVIVSKKNSNRCLDETKFGNWFRKSAVSASENAGSIKMESLHDREFSVNSETWLCVKGPKLAISVGLNLNATLTCTASTFLLS